MQISHNNTFLCMMYFIFCATFFFWEKIFTAGHNLIDFMGGQGCYMPDTNPFSLLEGGWGFSVAPGQDTK